jgi:hypothetical protein
MRAACPAPAPLLLVLLAVACGGPAPAHPEPAAPAASAEAPAPAAGDATSQSGSRPSNDDAAPAPAAARWPTACSDPAAPLCTPPGDFVERICAKPQQDVALALFSKETPFTRLYLKGKLDELNFDEEVLALRFHAPQKGGMVVGSGNGTYDLLRWDGTCSRGVEAEVIGRTRPPRPRSAHVKWHRIGSDLQDALIASCEPVKKAHAKRGKECQGAMSGEVSRACEAADQGLVDAVVDCVRTRGGVPAPSALP